MRVGSSCETFFGFFFHSMLCDAKCLAQRLLPNLPLGFPTPRLSPEK